jgi:hypothetical protein
VCSHPPASAAAVSSARFRYPAITTGDRTQTSPTCPGPSTAPSFPSTSARTPATGRPHDASKPGRSPGLCSSFRRLVHIPRHSVCPYPCISTGPNSSSASAILAGAIGAAPYKIVSSEDRSCRRGEA